MLHFTVAYVRWHRYNVFTKFGLHPPVYSDKFMPYLVYLHLHRIHKRGFYCFSLRRFSCHRSICNRCIFGEPISYFEGLINELLDRAKERDFPPVARVFCRRCSGFRVILQHPLPFIISSISTLCQMVTLLQSMII